MTFYVAVGFKVSKTISLFYFRERDLDIFIARLHREIQKKNPDFVSLRMVKEET